MPYISVQVEMAEFEDEDLVKECKERGLVVLPSVEENIELIAERAYLVAREMDDLPIEIKDLFWKVHGRAIS